MLFQESLTMPMQSECFFKHCCVEASVGTTPTIRSWRKTSRTEIPGGTLPSHATSCVFRAALPWRQTRLLSRLVSLCYCYTLHVYVAAWLCAVHVSATVWLLFGHHVSIYLSMLRRTWAPEATALTDAEMRLQGWPSKPSTEPSDPPRK